MKALSLTQPWATLVMLGLKRIETRSWFTPYRGRLAIHASKRFPKWAKEFSKRTPVSVLLGMDYEYPVGTVIATCRLISCLPTRELQENQIIRLDAATHYPDFEINEQERTFGDYTAGRWAWLLADIKAIPPVAAKGRLGLWEWQP